MTTPPDELEPKVRRVPIILSGHSIALLTIFRMPHDKLDDLWAWDWLREEVYTQHRRSAKQMIDSLDGHWTPAFMMALRDYATEALAQHDKEFGTKFADERATTIALTTNSSQGGGNEI